MAEKIQKESKGVNNIMNVAFINRIYVVFEEGMLLQRKEKWEG
ncbi:uncharacterized protein METZ01_LOCUS297607 [marine metagenome]|uniref:Uncharacterized protein n=1 Tax=marine metagenome TaxID=408172 RepID=A0A382M726_9ZZZZ